MAQSSKRQRASRGRSTARAGGAARKPRQRRGWLRTLLFFIFFPLIVWFAAFLLWFYWYNIVALFSDPEHKAKTAPKVESKAERREKSSAAPAEKILDEDRQKLDDILKRR